MLGFAASMLLGVCLGQFGLIPGWSESALVFVALITAALPALYPTGFFVSFVILPGIIGLLIGFLSTPDPGSFQATAIMLSGNFIGASLALFYLSSSFGWFQKRFNRWGRMGLRIVAAWIAAISILIASLIIAYP